MIDELTCNESSGAYQGDGTTCDPNPCPQPGACCFGDGTCSVLDTVSCAESSGEYLGDGSACDPNPCPQPALFEFIDSGVTHQRGSSTLCLLLRLDVAYDGSVVQVEFFDSSESKIGTQSVTLFGGIANFDQQIFFFDDFVWAVSRLVQVGVDVEFGGETSGAISVGVPEEPCER